MKWLIVLMVGLVGWVQAVAMDTPVVTKQVEDYFNGLGTYQARFSQRTTGEAWTQEGMFYLNRPKGQFLWNYESPDKQRLVATGTKLYFVNDEQGGAATELPVKSGLSRLFTGKQLSLAKEGLQVVDARYPDGVMRVSMVMAGKQAEETGGVKQVVLMFEAPQQLPTALVGAEVTDAMGQVTTMTFEDVKVGGVMDAKLFKFEPRQSRL